MATLPEDRTFPTIRKAQEHLRRLGFRAGRTGARNKVAKYYFSGELVGRIMVIDRDTVKVIVREGSA